MSIVKTTLVFSISYIYYNICLRSSCAIIYICSHTRHQRVIARMEICTEVFCDRSCHIWYSLISNSYRYHFRMVIYYIDKGDW